MNWAIFSLRLAGRGLGLDAGTVQFLISQAPTAALALVFLYLFATGKVHSDAEYDQLRKDYDTEKAAHEQTRQAYALATARADAGVRAAEMVAASLEGARRAAAPQAPPPP